LVGLLYPDLAPAADERWEAISFATHFALISAKLGDRGGLLLEKPPPLLLLRLLPASASLPAVT
jgi:hypothetical protein